VASYPEAGIGKARLDALVADLEKIG
jgi:hypothetical protein